MAHHFNPLGSCDLCAQVGIDRPATSEAPIGGVWASLCAAHAYRAGQRPSAACLGCGASIPSGLEYCADCPELTDPPPTEMERAFAAQVTIDAREERGHVFEWVSHLLMVEADATRDPSLADAHRDGAELFDAVALRIAGVQGEDAARAFRERAFARFMEAE